MRVKQIWTYFPLPSMLRLIWDRITASKISIFYVIFSLVHCILQVVFQSQAFIVNNESEMLLDGYIRQRNAKVPGFFVADGPDLRQCTTVPAHVDASSCSVVWSPSNNLGADDAAAVDSGSSSATTSQQVSSYSSPSPSASATSANLIQSTSGSAGLSASKVSSSSSQVTPAVSRLPQSAQMAAAMTHAPATTVTVFVTSGTPSPDIDDDDLGKDDDFPSNSVFLGKRSATNFFREPRSDVDIQKEIDSNILNLTETCVTALNWPAEQLSNTKREDLAFIAFQIWVLGMSFVAILNESIPHTLATLLTHMLATGWAGFQLVDTADFHRQFSYMITNGACKPNNLLPTYWTDRARAEVPLLVLNVVALLVSMFFTWRLIKLFGWQTFKRVGASLPINRYYKLVLTLSIVIQLSLYFMLATIGMWLDQLWNGSIARYASLMGLYKAVFITTIVMMIPWLMTGWFGSRREVKMLMFVFLALCVLYMGGWALMFVAPTFRWTFMQWRFFSIISVASVGLTLLAFILGLICRLNFGLNLSRFLDAQEPIPDNFVSAMPYDDPEKVDFPSTNRPVPTFSATFGSGLSVPPPAQMSFAPRQMGPRFFNPDVAPFETQPDLSNTTAVTGAALTRQSSKGSTSSSNSSDSIGRYKRWVIE